jgi:ketosteroid isomerase-like protein
VKSLNPVSVENVELVRRLQPRPDADLATLFRDEHAFALAEASLAPFFHPDCEVQGGPDSVTPLTGTGLRGLRDIWLQWLAPWASYRSEIEELIDLGERVLVLVRDFGSSADGGPEVTHASGAIWTVRDQKISHVVFYTNREAALRAAGR